jgi:hypothetical protein
MVQVSAKDELNTLLSEFKKKDSLIREAFEDILSDTEEFTASNEKNLQVLVQLEFKMFKLRLIVVNEYNKIKQILSDTTDVPVTIVQAFKKREVYIVATLARINELRADYDTIQKGCYYLRLKV